MKRSWILAAVGALAVVAIGAGAVFAQSGSDSGSGTTFLDRLAQKLGIDRPKLDQAIKDARTDQIDEAVQNGDLTQEQADKLKQKLDAMPNEGFGFGRGFKGGDAEKFHFGFGFGLGFGPDGGDNGAQKLADFLGVSTDQLKTELQADDATLATVAQAHGKSRDDLKSFIETQMKAALDKAVADGKLTQQRADEIQSNFSSRLDTFIDKPLFPFGDKFRGRFRHGAPDGDEDDGATPGATPQQGGELSPALRS